MGQRTLPGWTQLDVAATVVYMQWQIYNTQKVASFNYPSLPLRYSHQRLFRGFCNSKGVTPWKEAGKAPPGQTMHMLTCTCISPQDCLINFKGTIMTILGHATLPWMTNCTTMQLTSKPSSYCPSLYFNLQKQQPQEKQSSESGESIPVDTH